MWESDQSLCGIVLHVNNMKYCKTSGNQSTESDNILMLGGKGGRGGGQYLEDELYNIQVAKTDKKF